MKENELIELMNELLERPLDLFRMQALERLARLVVQILDTEADLERFRHDVLQGLAAREKIR